MRIAVLGSAADTHGPLVVLDSLPSSASVVAIGANVEEWQNNEKWSSRYHEANVLLIASANGKILSEALHSLPQCEWIQGVFAGLDHLQCPEFTEFDSHDKNTVTNAKGVFSSRCVNRVSVSCILLLYPASVSCFCILLLFLCLPLHLSLYYKPLTPPPPGKKNTKQQNTTQHNTTPAWRNGVFLQLPIGTRISPAFVGISRRPGGRRLLWASCEVKLSGSLVMGI